MEITLNEWLSKEPFPDEIRYNTDGSCYIPVEFIKIKLDTLDKFWGTKNFSHFLQHVQGRDYCFGNVELIVSFNEYKKNSDYIGGKSVANQRIISGAANFDLQKYQPNENWAATCLSLCIVNAAKELGIFFGKNLNKGTLTIPAPAPILNKDKVIKKSIDNLLNKM